MQGPVLLVWSIGHTVIVVVAVLLLFGGKKIPELMRGLGQGMKEFKNAQKDDPPPPPPSNPS